MRLFIFILSIALASPVFAEPLRVSSFSTILTEMAAQIGGDLVAVTGHVKPGSDPHDFEPKPEDLKTVAQAQVILLSAKHMEGYVDKLKEATGARGLLVQVGDQFPSLKLKGGHHHGHSHGPAGKPDAHDHGKDEAVEDPHWWHSIANAKLAVRVVRDAFTKADPKQKARWKQGADAYAAKLETLSGEVKAKLAELPRDQRKLVTSHDAFQYFAREYGFTIYAVEGVSAADQPSARELAGLIQLIKKEGVKAIFAENIQNPKVLEEITRESGAKMGGTLHADGLAEGDASTYAGMYLHNVKTIVEALK